MIRSYQELITIPTFEERYEYLRLDSNVGDSTFEYLRYLNQRFYTSKEWRSIRNEIIIRDLGNDLAMEGLPISSKIIIHHINPIDKDDIMSGNKRKLLDPDNLICTSFYTHEAIHFGDANLLSKPFVERCLNDTKLW